ncbi:DUF7373 family lipoprotein [Mycobacterium sp.]|uniref:DUF7373 family lipoprotein n=1 Tax=Mycobacterium sp. TaxID=1785 RepID=UPI002B69E0B7|nr:hypothetical protein [Mycobacterium sp.]HTQ21592.1 hypothetical protein [Mycobacterium sp.]
MHGKPPAVNIRVEQTQKHATPTVQVLLRLLIDHDLAAPDGLPDARCFEQKPAIWASDANYRYQCLVSFGRYVGHVWSSEEKDVRQRAAAQYAILVNSA